MVMSSMIKIWLSTPIRTFSFSNGAVWRICAVTICNHKGHLCTTNEKQPRLGLQIWQNSNEIYLAWLKRAILSPLGQQQGGTWLWMSRLYNNNVVIKLKTEETFFSKHSNLKAFTCKSHRTPYFFNLSTSRSNLRWDLMVTTLTWLPLQLLPSLKHTHTHTYI